MLISFPFLFLMRLMLTSFFFFRTWSVRFPHSHAKRHNIKRISPFFLFLSFFIYWQRRRRWQGSTLAVESRAAPTTVHELQPAAHQSVTSWSSAVPNNRRVVVVSNGSDSSSKKSGGGSGGSSEYQLQFAWPTVHKSIKKMPESLDGVFQQGQQHHHHHQHQQSNNNGNYTHSFVCLLLMWGATTV